MKPIINKITQDWIGKESPCNEALQLWDRKVDDPLKILKWLIKIKKLGWANWLIVRIMTYKDYVSYAVFAAEQVIDIYEKKYPEDKRPRQAIEAARKCIDNPTKENNAADAAVYAVVYAAAYAAYAAAHAAAAYAAAYAANAAAYAANAAAYAAAHAANAAAYAEMELKILKYGI